MLQTHVKEEIYVMHKYFYCSMKWLLSSAFVCILALRLFSDRQTGQGHIDSGFQGLQKIPYITWKHGGEVELVLECSF